MKLNVINGPQVFDPQETNKVIFPDCKEVQILSENYYKITTSNDTCILADNEGNIVPNITVLTTARPLHHIIVLLNQKYYFLLPDFTLSENCFDYIDLLSGNNDLVEVGNGNSWGFADSTGKLIIPLEYEHIHSFSQSTNLPLKVKTQGKFTFCNPKNGEKICNLLFDTIDFFRYHAELKKYTAKVSINGKINLLKENGELLFPEFVDEIRIENFGIFVKNNGLYGLFNFESKPIFNIEYSYISYLTPFEKFILKKNKKCGIASSTGKILVPCDYSEIERMNREYAICSKKNIENNDDGTISKKEEVVVIYKLGYGVILSSTKDSYNEALAYLLE